ncbi:MAG: hypothetical protein OXM61_07480 [Candidatus Poribacteria bacterium]|nr:hypothetical protein [Candidatus Poribacteria bacterium]
MNAVGQQAKLGLYFMKEAVSEILFNARENGPLRLAEISKRLGMTESDELPDRKNDLILSIMSLLQSEGRVQQINENGRGWKITEIEASRLKESLID